MKSNIIKINKQPPTTMCKTQDARNFWGHEPPDGSCRQTEIDPPNYATLNNNTTAADDRSSRLQDAALMRGALAAALRSTAKATVQSGRKNVWGHDPPNGFCRQTTMTPNFIATLYNNNIADRSTTLPPPSRPTLLPSRAALTRRAVMPTRTTGQDTSNGDFG
jgi:hypothetical protein